MGNRAEEKDHDVWDSISFSLNKGTDQPMFADRILSQADEKDEGGCVSLFKPGSNMRNKGWRTEPGLDGLMRLKGIHLIIKKLVKSNDYISCLSILKLEKS